MKFTGERFVPNLGSPEISYEHWHRYLYASHFVERKTVLDIACGEGYGSYLLSRTAKYVVGVDVSSEAINHAACTYVRSNLEFKLGSAISIPVEKRRSFDYVISFETIEHIREEEQEAFLVGVKRLLKPDGILLVSTPNKLVYSDIRGYRNEFHFREFYLHEFRTLLSKFFKHVRLLGQKIYSGSHIWDPDTREPKLIEYRLLETDSGFRPTDEPKEIRYLIAWCSDVGATSPPASVLLDLSEKIVKIRDEQIASLQQASAALEEQRSALAGQLGDRDQRIQHLQQASAALEGQLAHVSAETSQTIADLTTALTESRGETAHLNALKRELDAERQSHIRDVTSLIESRSWRITAPYRAVGRFLKRIAGFDQAAAPRAILYAIARRLYHFISLPKGIIRAATDSARRLLQPNAGLTIQANVTNLDFRDVYESEILSRTGKLGDSMDFVPFTDHNPTLTDIKAIAFYLPQFHPISKNDQNWERGFTEWTNVTKAMPRFVGHYQPHLPIDLGFYDLRLVDNIKRQVALAKNYGIYGFCFHHYWFNGKAVMQTPIDNFLAHPEIDFPFCINWANENWTRRWDGCDQEILLAQYHSAKDDLAFIRDAGKYLRDPRYIRVRGRPLLIVYRPMLFPNPRETAARWREYCRNIGLGDPYLLSTHAFDAQDPEKIGFDATVEYPPNTFPLERVPADQLILLDRRYDGMVLDYESAIGIARRAARPPYKKFRAICPSWDNEPRRPGRGTVLRGSTPEKYQQWLDFLCSYTIDTFDPEERLVFINAWNEWAEGAHLEPDRRFGYAYLEATARALCRYFGDFHDQAKVAVASQDAYPARSVELATTRERMGSLEEELSARANQDGRAEARRLEVLRDLISELNSLSCAFEASETWRIAKALQRLKFRPTGDPVRQLLHSCCQMSQYLTKTAPVDGIWLREPVSATRRCVEALLLSPTVRISRILVSLATCAQLRLPGPGALERIIGIAEALGQIVDFGSDHVESSTSNQVSQSSSARSGNAAQGSVTQGDVLERDLQQTEQASAVQPRAGSSLPEKLKEIEASGLFDREWYLAQYQHVQSTSMDPVAHYLCYGATEGLNPSPLFNTSIYVAAHRSRVHPEDALLHFHRSGVKAAPGAYRTPDILMEIQRRYQTNTEMRCLMDRRSRERRFMVYLQCGAGSVHQQWLTKGARQWELIVNHYDGTYVSRVPCDVEFQQVGRLPGTKFTSFLNLISNWPDAVRQYDAILLLDDDVLISEKDIATLFNIFESRSLDLAQASLTTDSDCAHPVCRRRNTNGVRYVNTVDLMMPILSRRSLEVGRHLFGQTVSGWGLDMVLGSLVSERLGGKAAVVDSVVAKHSKPIDTGGGAFYAMLHRARIYPEIELAHLQRLYGVGRNIFEIAVP